MSTATETPTTHDVLWCTLGEHNWERKKVRGRKPTSCPDHKPQPVRGPLLSPEEAQERRMAGRRRAQAIKDAEGIVKVANYREWVRADRAYWDAVEAKRNGDEEVIIPSKPLMPELPTKADYKAAGVEVMEDDE